jgi:hypothetical protein
MNSRICIKINTFRINITNVASLSAILSQAGTVWSPGSGKERIEDLILGWQRIPLIWAGCQDTRRGSQPGSPPS